MNVLRATELYTLKGGFLWHVNYIYIKIFTVVQAEQLKEITACNARVWIGFQELLVLFGQGREQSRVDPES